MKEISLKEYAKKLDDYSNALNGLVNCGYDAIVSDNFLDNLDKDMAMLLELKEKIYIMKKDYSARTGIDIDDILVKYMEEYYLLYSKNDGKAPYCYKLDENLRPYSIFSSSVNDKLLYIHNQMFMVALANLTIEENVIDNYSCYLMSWKDGKIMCPQNIVIEDVSEFYSLNAQLWIFKLNNSDLGNIYDVETNKIIIRDVDYIKPLQGDCGDFNKNECYSVSKVFNFDERFVTCSFYINNCGYIISDMVDSLGGYYVINDKESKDKYVDILQNKFEKINNIYQYKGYQLVKK